jgi:6-pyruvoyltetrahydropterin/6-carboxytetrahydropterin synthase
MNRRFQVELSKEQLTFCAAHFITYDREICEPLHGHNFGVRCIVEGYLTSDRYVIDFILLRDELAKIVGQLNHRVLLPTKHPLISVRTIEQEVVAEFRERRWVFPAADCCLLPVANTTAEEIAQYVGEQLITGLETRLGALDQVERLVVGIDENQGQWGSCTLIDRTSNKRDSAD